jgi:hypothetical protein
MSEMLHWLICVKREICVKGKKRKMQTQKGNKGRCWQRFYFINHGTISVRNQCTQLT